MDRKEQVDKNLELFRRHMHRVLDHGVEPWARDGDQLVSLPSGDRELREANVRLLVDPSDLEEDVARRVVLSDMELYLVKRRDGSIDAYAEPDGMR